MDAADEQVGDAVLSWEDACWDVNATGATYIKVLGTISSSQIVNV